MNKIAKFLLYVIISDTYCYYGGIDNNNNNNNNNNSPSYDTGNSSLLFQVAVVVGAAAVVGAASAARRLGLRQDAEEVVELSQEENVDGQRGVPLLGGVVHAHPGEGIETEKHRTEGETRGEIEISTRKKKATTMSQAKQYYEVHMKKGDYMRNERKPHQGRACSNGCLSHPCTDGQTNTDRTWTSLTQRKM